MVRADVRFALLLLALPLAACGQQTASPSGNTAAPAEHGYHAKVQALSPKQREIMLFRAIRSGGGGSCQDVKKVVDRSPAKNGDPAWLVTCDDDAEWYVQLGDDGTALVTAARNDGPATD